MKNNIYLMSLKSYFQNPQTRTIAFASAGIFAILLGQLLVSFFSSPEVSIKDKDYFLSEHIPDGYSVVPIELINAESISSLMGSIAFVDLYATEHIMGKRQILLKNIKMLKTANQDGQFSLIINDSESSKIGDLNQPLFAVLKKKQSKKSSKKKKHSRVYNLKEINL